MYKSRNFLSPGSAIKRPAPICYFQVHFEPFVVPLISVNTLVAHHKKDACKVTQFNHAKNFYDELQAPRKYILVFDGGVPTGRKCGPLHHHGFENIEEKAAKKIIEWMVSDAVR